jgi:hypothetical protein
MSWNCATSCSDHDVIHALVLSVRSAVHDLQILHSCSKLFLKKHGGAIIVHNGCTYPVTFLVQEKQASIFFTTMTQRAQPHYQGLVFGVLPKGSEVVIDLHERVSDTVL